MSGRAGGRNENLSTAKRARDDEFYTRLEDIERELYRYPGQFKDKVVFCNCDDPRVSNFFHYFSHNFEHLGLNRLITTCYKNQEPTLFSRHDRERAVSLVYEGDRNGNRVPDPEEIGIRHLDGDGDFRSPESVEMLKQADVVVTNPPFSMFREYVAQLVEHDKKFLIIGNFNAITYKEIFPLIRDNKMWTGFKGVSGGMMFDVPPEHAKRIVETKKEGSSYRMINGKVLSIAPAVWFTNLDHDKRHESIPMFRRYSPEDYPRYDNYDAINVNKVVDIPIDYKGAMGVPITYLEKHNPDQFEILGTTDRGECASLRTRVYDKFDSPRYGILNACGTIRENGEFKTMFTRIFIRRKGTSQ